jgi:hypothetical protein
MADEGRILTQMTTSNPRLICKFLLELTVDEIHRR